MLYVKESGQSRIRKCETMSKLATGVYLILTVLKLVAYFVLQTIDFMLWYTRACLEMHSWFNIRICASFMLFESTTSGLFQKQKRVGRRLETHSEKIRKSLMSPKRRGQQFEKIKQVKSLRRKQSIYTPGYIINQNNFLIIFGASKFLHSWVLIIATIARGDPITYMIELTLIDIDGSYDFLCFILWKKHITANFSCLGCLEKPPGESQAVREP